MSVVESAQAFLRALVVGREAARLRRFVAVGVVAAGFQTALLGVLVEVTALQYLLAAAVAIEVTILLQYGANNAWTFAGTRHAGAGEYARGLLKTNLVRGSAIPIQLSVLFGLVEWVGLPYLLGNVLAIGISGLYRYALDSRWTWG